MEFARFLDSPVVDGHIHFPRPELMADVVGVMDDTGLARANLVALPDLQAVNQNPALIHFKSNHPNLVYICGALDYMQIWADPDRAAQTLANQIAALQAIGFDGLKLIEGKPIVRKLLGLPLDGPEYTDMWAVLEETGTPIVLHLADPEEFWDAERCPDWARAQGWFYGDGSYPTKEDLYGEVNRILDRYPDLTLVLAHFYFLSANLERAGAFLDAHPRVCFDLTPGVEMYYSFARDTDAAHRFFVRYQDRLVYGTDIGASATVGNGAPSLDRAESLGRAWVVRRFLETEDVFAAPEGVGHWLGMDTGLFRGIALPPAVLEKVYHSNFERIFGTAPAPLDPESARVELERLAAVVDSLAGGEAEDNPARWVARRLKPRKAPQALVPSA
jgi:predicted TIM-barrel fold metal-dependent hydrolase